MATGINDGDTGDIFAQKSERESSGAEKVYAGSQTGQPDCQGEVNVINHQGKSRNPKLSHGICVPCGPEFSVKTV